MKTKVMSVFAAFIAFVSVSFGQIATVKPLYSFAAQVRADTSFVQNVLWNIDAYPASFSFNSITFNKVAAPSFFIGNNASGEFRLKVSYITEESWGENILSIGNATTNTLYTDLYSTYDVNDFSYEVSKNGSLAPADFHNNLLSGYNIESWGNNSLHFDWYSNGVGGYFGLIDDIGTSLNDNNDSIFYVETVFIPSQDSPTLNNESAVPESSTYALFGSLVLLLGAFFVKRAKNS